MAKFPKVNGKHQLTDLRNSGNSEENKHKARTLHEFAGVAGTRCHCWWPEQRLVFSPSASWKSTTKGQKDGLLPRPLSITCRWPPFRHVLMRPSLWACARLGGLSVPQSSPLMGPPVHWIMACSKGLVLPSSALKMPSLQIQPHSDRSGHQYRKFGWHNSAHNTYLNPFILKLLNTTDSKTLKEQRKKTQLVQERS